MTLHLLYYRAAIVLFVIGMFLRCWIPEGGFSVILLALLMFQIAIYLQGQDRLSVALTLWGETIGKERDR